MKIKKIIIESLFFLAGMFFVILNYIFIQPYNAKGIINAGTIIGITACLFFAFLCFFHHFVKKLVLLLLKSTLTKILLYIVIFSFAAGIFTACFLSIKMINQMNNYPPKECQVMVVLGCKLDTDVPCEMLATRLDAAYEYLNSHSNVICITSGGQGPNEKIPEGNAMKTYLVNKGIDENRIIIENKSKNTSENIKFSLDLLDQKPDNIIIVTDGFHEFRSSMLAKAQGITSYAVSADTRNSYIPPFWVREWLGIIKDYIFISF